MSFPPALLSVEGWISVSVCYIIYTISFVSVGKLSIIHKWLFTDLTVYSPTDESVAAVAACGGNNINHDEDKDSPQNNHNKTTRERLDALEIEATNVEPGMVTLNSLQSSTQSIRLWTNIDNACVCAFSCIFSLLVRFCWNWILVLFQPKCCADIPCWVAWLHRQQNAVPLLALLALMAFHSAWTLGKLSSSNRMTGRVIAGVILALSSLWIINAPAPLDTLHISAAHALEEGAARILLWARLVGIRISNELKALEWLILAGKVVFSLFAGSLGFVLWDPLQGTSRILVYRSQRLLAQPSKRQWKWIYSMLAMTALFFLPLLILLTYLVSNDKQSYMKRINARTMAAWLFVLVLGSLIKDLLQAYMDQANAEVAIVLSEPSPPIADRVMYPFRNRFQKLVETAGQLVTFPFCLVALLTMGHLCNVNCDMYPVPYKGAATLDNKGTKTQRHYWEKHIVVNTANSATNSTLVLSHISPTRANACGKTIEPKRRYRKKLGTGRQLLSYAKPVKKSLLNALGGLQVLALMAREDQIARKVLEHTENRSAETNDFDEYFLEDTGKSADDLVAAITAVIMHPVLTSTVVFPILDLTGFLLCILWLVAFVGGVAKYRKRMRELGSYEMMVKKNK